MARRVPHQHRVGFFKLFQLEPEQPVVGGQPRQKHQRRALPRSAHPVMDDALRGVQQSFRHGSSFL